MPWNQKHAKTLWLAVTLLLWSAPLFLAFEMKVSGEAAKKEEDGVKDRLYKEGQMYFEVRQQVLEKYVDKVDEEKLFQGAIKGMLSTLDPYCGFYDEDKARDLREDIDGEFAGIGVRLDTSGDYPVVVTPMKGTPAFEAGVKAGDRILEVDGQSVKDSDFEKLAKLLRGKPGTEVSLKLLRRGEEKPDKAQIVRFKRAIIGMQSLREYAVIDAENKIGYIRIKEFQKNTTRQFQEVRDELIKSGVKSLILDLRDNPGGSLYACLDICDEFIAEGSLLLTRGRDKEEKHKAKKGQVWESNLKVAVLVDGGSASASEIVAGCLQDHKRASIVGHRTYGKGSVQTIIPLKSGSGNALLKLTQSKYFTPEGHSVDRSKDGTTGGIVPDYEVEISDEQKKKMFENWEELEIIDPDLKVERYIDPQLSKALEILKK